MNTIYLEDLLAEGDFFEAANGLSRRVRDTHDFPPLHQVAAVVPDVELAAADLEQCGIGPFFVMAGTAAYWQERGQLRKCRLKLGTARYEGIEIELLEPVHGSGIHEDALDLGGKPVVRSLGFLVRDVDAWAQKLEASGTPLWVRATVKGAGLTADLAYMAKNKDDGLSMEFICTKLMGIPLTLPGGMVHAIGRIQKATGKRCLKV